MAFEQQKQQLEDTRAGLQKEISELEKPLPREAVKDTGEYALANTFGDQRAIRLERARRRLVGIVKALERFDNGTYGICPLCKEEIEANRLETLPEVVLCKKCKSKSSGEEPELNTIVHERRRNPHRDNSTNFYSPR